MLRLLVTLQGEIVRDVKPVIGYVHTGIEKTAEDKSYWKVIPVVERMDYLAYYFNAMAYCCAVETLVEVEVPARGQYLRVIHLELNRIASHLIWLGTSALDLGAVSIFLYCLREREMILDLFEMSSGARMHTRYFQVGGVIEDIPAGFEGKLREFLKVMPERADEYGAILNANEIVLQRLRGTCPLDAETLLGLGVTGPLLRAAGNPWDLRKADPYCSYEDFDFKIPVGTVGDNYDRYAVRLAEIYESVKIIEQALDGLPEGPHITTDRKVALPPRHELATSMEALIHHFKLVTEGFRVPPGRGLLPDRVPARRARLLRALRRIVQARARAHARPVLREPAGRLAHGQGQLHRRHDRDGGDARSDPRGDRPVSPLGWDAPADLEKDPAEIPDPETTEVPAALRAEIEAHMANYPDRRSATLPALAAAQRVHGWCSPEAIEQVACVMRLTPAYLESVASFYDMLETTPVGATACTCAPTSPARCVAPTSSTRPPAPPPREDPEVNVRAFECLGACDIAPMASVDGVYVGPLTPGDVPALLEDIHAGRPVLPERQLARRLVADPRANTREFPEHPIEGLPDDGAANLELTVEDPATAIGEPGGERPGPTAPIEERPEHEEEDSS